MEYDPKYAKLYHAVRTGNLEATSKFVEENPGALTAIISVEGKRPLHVAVLFGHLHIVKELLQSMSAEDVELLDFNPITALQEVSYTSYINIAECLVEKNSNLLQIVQIAEGIKLIPVTNALDNGQIEMARYLYSVTPKEVLSHDQHGNHGATLLNLCYYSNLFDMALDLLHNCPSLAVTPDRRGETFLEALASIPSAFPSGTQLSFWQRWIYNALDIRKEQIQQKYLNEEISVNIPETTMSQSDKTITTKTKIDNNAMVFIFSGIKNMYQVKLGHMQARELLRIACEELYALNEQQLIASRASEAVAQATTKGIPEIFTEMIKVHLSLLWHGGVNSARSPIFDAVQFRQARVFNLVHGMIWKNTIHNMRDRNGNTLLHMAGLLAPSTELHNVSGAALQMQRELQWFKEVESITPSNRKETLNNDKCTARQLFTENHKELVKQGEKWMKGTASSCSLVATLVATIVFAAAFTVPGGNDETGRPALAGLNGFMIFIISDAVSLFTSSTSILMFLNILTSRYAEDDFLESLPRKLILGLLTLFISMATMLIAFCALLILMLDRKLWIVMPVSVLAAVPVISFGWLQYPLLREMIMSTYWPGIFDRDVKPWLTADLITN